MSQENTPVSREQLPPSIQWPSWSLLLWREGRFQRQVVQLRPLSSEREEHLDCYLIVQLSPVGGGDHVYCAVGAYGTLVAGRGHTSPESSEEGWFSLWPQIHEEQAMPAEVQQAREEFDRQVGRLVEYINGQLLGTGWRCGWVDVMSRESHEDDARGIYEHVTRRRGHSFPERTPAEAGFAKDVEFVIG